MTIPSMHRRHLLALCAGAALAQPAWATDGVLPITVPWPAGGIADTYARQIQAELSRASGMTAVIENITGAGGLIALDRYVRRPANDRGLFLCSNSDLIATLLTSRGTTRLQPEDFRLACVLGTGPFAFVVRDGLLARTVDEVFRAVRAPGAEPLKVGHTGVGSLFHLAWEDVLGRTGVPAVMAPYRGAPDILRDLANGAIDAAMLPLATPVTSYPGTRTIGMSGAMRHPSFPQLQPLTESESLRGYVQEGWFGMAVPRETPAEELARTGRWLQVAMRTPAFLESVRANGGLPPPEMDRAQLDRFYETEVSRLRAAAQRIRTAG